MRDVILEADTSVKERVGDFMNHKGGLIYEEQEVFKYGLIKAKKYYTFHSMVMYVQPDAWTFIAAQPLDLKIQKGCINFRNIEDFPMDVFERFMQLCASKDFSGVIERYRRKTR